MSGLNPESIDLAITSKPQIARILQEYSPSKYSIRVGGSPGFVTETGVATAGTDGTKIEKSGAGWTPNEWQYAYVTVPGKGKGLVTSNDADTLVVAITPAPTSSDTFIVSFDVNPIMGNNFEMTWDESNTRVIIHNDYPIYSGSDYYHMENLDPSVDKYVPLNPDLTNDATPYNHMFLVDGAAHVGNLEIVVSSSQTKPTPVGVETLYIGWVYRGVNDEIIIKNVGRMIDQAFEISTVSNIDFLDLHTNVKVTEFATNLLKYVAFFGPGITKTINEVGLFVQDVAAEAQLFSYIKLETTHSLADAENLRVSWKITV